MAEETFTTILRRLVILSLFIYFATRVYVAYSKLEAGKIGTLFNRITEVTVQYPAITSCVYHETNDDLKKINGTSAHEPRMDIIMKYIYYFKKGDNATYEMAKLTAKDIASQSQDLAYFHRAIFKKTADLKVLASCVTFATQDRVPPGSLYNIGIYLNTTGADHIRTYVYNDNQMYVPNGVGAFGSTYKQIEDLDEGWNFYLTRTRLKKIDRPSQRCDAEIRHPNTTSCILEFIEDKLECSLGILDTLGSDRRSKKAPCHSSSRLKELVKLSEQLDEADDTEIYEMTGCLSACEKDKFDVILGHGDEGDEEGEVLLTFTINDRFYSEEEQYVIYDFDSFMADWGGYMGLVLGYSILQIYDDLVRMMMVMFKTSFGGLPFTSVMIEQTKSEQKDQANDHKDNNGNCNCRCKSC